MKNYYRVMLGRKSVHAAECLSGNFIGTDFDIEEDLTGHLSDNWRTFNQTFIPIFLKNRPDKTKIAAGLACSFLWTVSHGIRQGDIVLCPDGTGSYRVGEITGGYAYAPGQTLPHRRPVRWLAQSISRDTMSDALRNSAGSIGTVSDISKHRDEIEKLIGAVTPPPALIATDATVEDPAIFALEKHLEDFLVENWEQTELGKNYDIFEDEGEKAGQQYPTDTGAIDIFAISKSKKELLIIELKKGRASDIVVGQTLRYMGYVQEELAEPGQTVRGIIIALDDDQKLRRALVPVPSIAFYRYQVNFKLIRA